MSTTSNNLLPRKNEGQKETGLLTSSKVEERNGYAWPRGLMTYGGSQERRAHGNHKSSKGHKWKGKAFMVASGDNGKESDEDPYCIQHNSLRESSIHANDRTITSNNDVEDLAVNTKKKNMIQKSTEDKSLTVGVNELVEILITNESHGVTRSKNQPTWKRVTKGGPKKA